MQKNPNLILASWLSGDSEGGQFGDFLYFLSGTKAEWHWVIWNEEMAVFIRTVWWWL